MAAAKTVLFFPLNSPGHVNSSLGIADVLKEEHGLRTVFLVLGSVIGTSIRDHGHELIILDEANAHQDYEVDEDEDPTALDVESKRREGKSKGQFRGALKWPQILQRQQNVLKLKPVDALLESMHLEKLMVEELVENCESVEEAIKKINPDLIIVDAYYIAPCIINLKHIPWIRLFSANPLQVVRSKLPDGLKPPPMIGCKLLNKEQRNKLRQEDPAKWQKFLDEWQSVLDRLKKAPGNFFELQKNFYEKHGCKPLEPGQIGHDSPHLNIYMYPEALDYDQDDDIFEYPARWFRCDSLVRKPMSSTQPSESRLWNEKLDEAVKGKKEIIYFSLGSIASGNAGLMKRFVEMLKNDTNRLYVISKGVNGDKYKLNEDNMIGDNYLPQTLFLERADLAIIHGGNNSVTECFYYGVPMIVIPVFADQFDNAQRVEDLGLGRRLDAFNCTGEELIGAVNEILNNSKLVERIREIGKKMRAQRDSSKISLMVKKLLEEKQLTTDLIEHFRTLDLDKLS